MRTKTDDYQTVRIWAKTHKRLRKIAAETGESLVQVLDRLSEQELKQIQQTELKVSNK
jgi:hypothetical protein